MSSFHTVKNRIILASFGTDDVRGQQVIASVATSVAAAFPQFDVCSACRKTLEIALSQAVSDKVAKLIIQPTHLIHGIEYRNLTRIVDAWRLHFCSLYVGKPLLSSTPDIKAVANALINYNVPDSNAAILMGHGTKHGSNKEYHALQAALNETGVKNYYIALLNGTPTLLDIYHNLSSYSGVTLIPLMLTAGAHAKKHMLGKWQNTLQDSGFHTSCLIRGLGELNEIHQIYIKHIEEIVAKEVR